jgi:predicted peroxiredoxin
MSLQTVNRWVRVSLIGLGLVASAPALSQTDAPSGLEPSAPQLFVTVTGDTAQQRAMPLVLANQATRQGATVRVLLCDAGGELALNSYQASELAPRGMTPKDLLKSLIERGAVVEVCAIFLPNTPHTQADLMPGIGIAKPQDIAAFMLEPNTRLFTH